ncbi:MAG: SDR family oxidoreductase [Candidatus Eremiobacteraeota bacterium]|nr:SDR family oxidoreductase [Candidatus Eremiobacteraeota bacterium]
MVVLVTGAAGFIGSHLVDAYLARGCTVIGLDNLTTGARANLEHALYDKRFFFVQADIAGNIEDFERLLRHVNQTPNLILHFASPASPKDYADLPLETMAANAMGTRNCLEVASQRKARFLFASTSESYGDPLEHPQKETYWGHVNPIGPRSCYDESKRYGEALTMAYWRTRDVDARIVRIFNTYGPRMREKDGRVVPNFVRQALAGEPLTIYGDGTQTRSFCYIDDLIDGIVRYASAPSLAGNVINLGNPAEFSILEFAKVVSSAAGVPLRFAHAALPQDDPARRCPDITKAQTVLGWQPKVELRDGVAKTIDHFRAVLGPN